jgi:hypothetical protein
MTAFSPGALLAFRIMAILKERFGNLTVEQTAELAAKIIQAIDETPMTPRRDG